ncbi:hypothetical protein LguiA_032840 [Lonicera macranthoides]
MWTALRSRRQYLSPSLLSSSPSPAIQQWPSNNNKEGSSLNLEEVEKILCDVKADDVKVIPIKKNCDFADFMVVATGRSPWHVRNIAQALIYKAVELSLFGLHEQVKQKQKGSKRVLLPSVEGQEGGKWIVIDSGALIIHALDEKVRAYYNLEKLWTTEESNKEQSQELEKAFVKVRRKNNSKKKPVNASA